MLHKKPAVLLSSYTSLHTSFCNPRYEVSTSSSLPTSAPHYPPRCISEQHKRPTPRIRRRSYATVSKKEIDDLPWPTAPAPTPYQIFHLEKSAPYSKRRFYDLVKLYHPDRAGHQHEPSCTRDLPHALRVERYRLVVAANDILSDPACRQAYDRHGLGWHGAAESRAPSYSPRSSRYGHGGNNWNSRGPPDLNATWEDWERWYRRDAKGPQAPSYAANGTVISLIALFAVLGGMGQASRVESASSTFVEHRDRVHDRTSRELVRRRKQSTSNGGHKDERIESFLKTRDPVAAGVVDPIEEEYRAMLPDAEVCSSEDIKERSMGVYHKDEDAER
ncbi:MAG: hypothetical protein M1833_004704 [Piccolia ochrophora]|nr:MAG: hypothetical protein M1833_004704 [Piccolia ochrophora]